MWSQTNNMMQPAEFWKYNGRDQEHIPHSVSSHQNKTILLKIWKAVLSSSQFLALCSFSQKKEKSLRNMQSRTKNFTRTASRLVQMYSLSIFRSLMKQLLQNVLSCLQWFPVHLWMQFFHQHLTPPKSLQFPRCPSSFAIKDHSSWTPHWNFHFLPYSFMCKSHISGRNHS